MFYLLRTFIASCYRLPGDFALRFSKHRPSGPMLSISWNVCLSVGPCVPVSVCPCVCSLLRYRLTAFLPPLPKVGCQIFLEIRNPWVKVMERSGLTFEHFCLEVVYNCRTQKKFFFFADFALQNMVETKLPDGNFGISLDVLEFLRFGWFFLFFKKIRFLGILGPPGNHASQWIRAYR